MKSVYILVTSTRTVFSRGMRMVVTDEFTHASISLDREMRQVFSFARKHEKLMLPAGFVREDIYSGVYGKNPDAPCALLELNVSDEVYARIARRLYSMISCAEDYRYSILGVFLCKFDIAYNRERHYFCSQFVADVLENSGAMQMPKPVSLMRPSDFCRIPKLKLVYRGPLAYCSHDMCELPCPAV